MPSYTNTEPDLFNLNTLLSKHGDKLKTTKTFNLNQPNTATFTKPIPIPQLKELATKTAKKSTNDGIQDLNLENALQYLITLNINSHILARVIIYYDIQNQPRISIKSIKEKYNTACFLQAEEFIISYYKITIPNANDNMLFFSPKATNHDDHTDETTPPPF
ncbi:32426_t:CDS:2 [Gigaspora margarita]|uniref:32426_t:CDS:1 n=1 Tax=Gigaspora margarita TaxID=4874 RepID=A0ABM8VW58_GIGMA|nr:32426_t:CDS:2 [Gigaspora margarita]